MGGRGSSLTNSTRYVRFGDYSDYSINYLSLSLKENEDLSYLIDTGVPMLEAIARSVDDYENRNIFEDGVSVFTADKNGMPIIENAQQLNSLIQRIGAKAYLVSGKKAGSGTDNEPIIKNAKKVDSLSKSDIEKHIERTLSDKYETVKSAGNADNFVGNDFVVFNGKRYSKPIKSWNTKQGADVFKQKDSGLRLRGGSHYEEVNIKDVAKNVSRFTSKSGKDMVRYTYDGKERTDTVDTFGNKKVVILITEPYKVVRIKK